MVRPGIFEVFFLLLVPAVIALRFLPTAYAVCAALFTIVAVVLYNKYVVLGQLKALNIPHDDPTLFLGHAMKMSKMGFHEFDMKAIKKHGKIYGAYFGPLPVINVADVDILKDILVKDFHNFTNRPMPIPLLKDSELSIFSKMLSIQVDDRWRNLRSTMSPAFTAGKMKLMIPLMDHCVDNLVARLEKQKTKRSDSAVCIQSLLGGLTMDVICTCALGTETNSIEDPNNPIVVHARKIVENVKGTLGQLILIAFPYLTTNVFPSLAMKLVDGGSSDYLKGVVLRSLEDRRRNPQKARDMLNLLLNAHEDNDSDEAITAYPSDGSTWSQKKHCAMLSDPLYLVMTDDEIIAQLLIFLIAGYHTTAATLTFCLHCLATHPEVQQKCFEEIEEAVCTGPLAYDVLLNKLPYLESVISETLRMFPPAVMLQRECREDYVALNGYRIPAGMSINVPVYAIHHMEEYYENPHEFNPERFSPEEKARRNPLTFQPFGFGPRNCIGMRFAIMEIKLTLANLIKNFEFSPCDKTEVRTPISTLHALQFSSDSFKSWIALL